ncbi:MAG: hypothetical protein Q9166_007341 [cf. Caloplaca sp. 2 TL-2023]
MPPPRTRSFKGHISLPPPELLISSNHNKVIKWLTCNGSPDGTAKRDIHISQILPLAHNIAIKQIGLPPHIEMACAKVINIRTRMSRRYEDAADVPSLEMVRIWKEYIGVPATLWDILSLTHGASARTHEHPTRLTDSNVLLNTSDAQVDDQNPSSWTDVTATQTTKSKIPSLEKPPPRLSLPLTLQQGYTYLRFGSYNKEAEGGGEEIEEQSCVTAGRVCLAGRWVRLVGR